MGWVSLQLPATAAELAHRWHSSSQADVLSMGAIAQIFPVPPPSVNESPAPADADASDSDDAEEEEPVDEFPPNPLEIREPDPLLPNPPIERPLSPLEILNLRRALDDLQRQGDALYQAGDLAGALEIWNRELRLRRALGYEEEVAALGRVGEIAWTENDTAEVRIITQRLQTIEQEVQAQTPVNYTLLLSIAQAYQKLRAYTPAVTLYNQILERSRAQQDSATEQAALAALADLHYVWFNYTEAAAAYEELLKLARARGDRLQEVEYLKQLAYVYQQSGQAEQAIGIQEQLISVYQTTQQVNQIPAIKLAIGDSYRAINRLDRASIAYQEAFAIARTAQQLGYASDALKRLADLYSSINRYDDALLAYQVLIDIERQSYNLLGVMNALDQIGQIHRLRGNAPQAIAAFQQGLQLAQQMSYASKADYFVAQIQALSQPPSPPPAAFPVIP